MAIPQPKITAAFKKKVKHDWQEQISTLIPDLKRFMVSRLLGPLMIGISFDTKTFNNEYYPVFDCQTLFDVREHLGRTMLKRLMNSRINIAGDEINFVVSISVRRHEKGEYIEAAQLMKEQALLPLEGPISISMIWQAYQKFFIKEPAYFNMSIVEDPALIAAWAGREDIAKKALEWGYESYKACCENHRNKNTDDDPDAWLTMMEKRIADPETLRQNVKEMITKHKLEYLPQEELILE